MLRVLLQYLVPLLLPFAVYAVYLLLTEHRQPDWLGLDGRQWLLLGGAGLTLVAISMVTWSLLSGAPPSEKYIPPHLEDGRIVPGTTVAE
jgi:Family of unknown function (DUF6111)